MKNLGKRMLVALAAALVLSPAAWAGQGVPVVKVNGVVLYEAELNEQLNLILPAASFHRVSEEKRASYIPKAMEEIIVTELFYQEALAKDMEVDKKKVKDAVNAEKKRLGGRKALNAAIKARGLTMKEYKEKVRRSFLVKDLAMLEIDQRAVVADEDVAAHYERNKSGYFRPSARRIRHILINVDPSSLPEQKEARRMRAQEVHEKAVAGEDFATLAWDYSDDPYRVKGGDLGLIHKGRLDPELDKVAFSLPVGQLSGVLETIYGFHVLRVEEEKKGEQLSLKDVRQQIKRQLHKEKLKHRRAAYIAQLKEKSEIEILK